MKVSNISKNRKYRFFTICAYKNGERVCKRVGWSWKLNQWMAALHGEDWLENKRESK